METFNIATKHPTGQINSLRSHRAISKMPPIPKTLTIPNRAIPARRTSERGGHAGGEAFLSRTSDVESAATLLSPSSLKIEQFGTLGAFRANEDP